MDRNELNNDIIEFLKKCKAPMEAESIAESLVVPQYKITSALQELIMGNQVKEMSPDNKNSARKYYTIKDKQTIMSDKKVEDASEGVNFENIVAQEAVNAKDNYKDLAEKVEMIDKNVNGIYANIISIMSIFVAIFALITVNANITFKLTQKNMCEVFWGIVIVNIVVVICIIALLIGIKFILINPMIGKKK